MKALLVLDMPCSCADCRFCQYEDSIKSSFCTADPTHMFKMNEEGGVYSMRRDLCCPLKSLPKTKERIDGEDFREWECEDHYKNGYANGWNDCLEEIQNDN